MNKCSQNCFMHETFFHSSVSNVSFTSIKDTYSQIQQIDAKGNNFILQTKKRFCSKKRYSNTDIPKRKSCALLRKKQ